MIQKIEVDLLALGVLIGISTKTYNNEQKG